MQWLPSATPSFEGRFTDRGAMFLCHMTSALAFHNLSIFFLFSSVAQLCLTLCDPMDCSTPGCSWSITNSQSLLKLMSIELVMPSNHLILCHALLLLSSVFPSIGVFSNWLLVLDGQSVGTSASVLPTNIQGSFPLGCPCSPRDSQESSPAPWFGTETSLWSNSHIVCDYWKNHSFDLTDLCWQNVSAF